MGHRIDGLWVHYTDWSNSGNYGMIVEEGFSEGWTMTWLDDKVEITMTVQPQRAMMLTGDWTDSQILVNGKKPESMFAHVGWVLI